MSSPQSTVPEDVQVTEELLAGHDRHCIHLSSGGGLHVDQRCRGKVKPCAAAGGGALLLALWVLVAATPIGRPAWPWPVRSASDAANFLVAAAAKENKTDSKSEHCAALWGQCGGADWRGTTCCEKGSKCVDFALEDNPTYRQCRTACDRALGPGCDDAADGKPDDAGDSANEAGGNTEDVDDEEEKVTSKKKKNAKGKSKGCANKLWGQCGGANWTGPTCCESGGKCVDYQLDEYPTYRQCREPDEPPECEDAQKGSSCKAAIDAARAAGRGGLTQDMDDKEYQMFLNWMDRDAKEQSGCPPPCTPGSCFTALHVEGCDTLNTWYCEHDDGSLKFACCCSWFHKEKRLEKPEHPDAAMKNAMKAVNSDSPSLFCTAMCLPNGYELSLLQAQYERGQLGLFGCNEWDVYSNKSLRLTPKGAHPEIRTEVINGSLSAEVGGNWKTALNTEIFIKFWDQVLKNKKAWECDWIVKVDPDTMWMPVRLQALLRTREGLLAEKERPGGIYLNNCHVGLHGPIEVLSKAALGNYKGGRHKCEKGKAGTRGQEDWFLRDCFESLGVERVDAYNLMLEATQACQEAPSSIDPEDRPPCMSPQVAFHPFKAIHTWMRCHTEAANHPWQLPTVPWTEGPNEGNERHE